MSALEPTNEANAEAFAKMGENHAAALEDVRAQVSNSQIMSALEAQGYAVDEWWQCGMLPAKK